MRAALLVLLAEGSASFLDGANPHRDSGCQKSGSANHQSKTDPVIRKKGTAHDHLISAGVDVRQGDRCGHTSSRENKREG